MSATIAAALKKIAVSLLTDRKALKIVGGIVLGIIVIIVMPIAAVLAVFSGDINIDIDRLQEMVEENLSDDQQAKLQSVEDMMNGINDAMTEAGYEDRAREAQVLYVMALSDKAADEDFLENLVGCFSDDQSYEDLIDAVNDVFDTDISTEDFEKMMDSMSTPETDTACYTIDELCLSIV